MEKIENKKEIFDKEYAEYYDLFNESKDYSQEVEFLEQVFKKYSEFKVQKILDLGCGTGIHAGTLSLKGYNLVGLDLSKEMIEIANLKSQGNKNIKFIVGDMSNFSLNLNDNEKNKFDVCISMFSALGYLTENKQIESCLKSIKKHLKKKGLLIIDCWNGLAVMRKLPSIREKSVEKGDLKIIRKSFPNLNSEKHLCDVKFDVKIFKNKNLIKEYEELHKVRFFFPQELRKYLEDSGFRLLEICEAYKLNSEINENIWNMILIARLME